MEQEIKKRGRPRKIETQSATSPISTSPFTDEQVKLFSNVFFTKMTDTPLSVVENKINGYTREQIENILSNPEGNQSQLISLSNYAYRSYAFFQQVVDYFSNMPLFRPVVNTLVRNQSFYQVNKKQLQKNYYTYVDTISKMKFDGKINEIFKLILLEDTVYGFWLDIESSKVLYILPSSWCKIRRTLNGVFLYGINTRNVPQSDIEKLPDPIAKLIKSGKQDKDGYVYPEPVDSFVLKWNNHLTYSFPPLFSLIAPILNVKDYQDLEKAKTEQENYSLLSYEIPTGEGLDELKLTDKVVMPFMNMTKSIVPKSIGVTVNPLKVTPVSFKGSSTNDKDRVKNAVQNFYDESGISPSVMAGTSSGSELKQSLLNDQMDIWRIYRQIETVLSLHMDLLGMGTYPSYKFEFKMLDVTHYNISDFIKEQLSLAQASLPVKTTLASAVGLPVNSLLGASYMENYVLGQDDVPLGSDWTVLKTSYTSSSSKDAGGRPSNESSGTSVAEVTEVGIENDSNDPDNRT